MGASDGQKGLVGPLVLWRGRRSAAGSVACSFGDAHSANRKVRTHTRSEVTHPFSRSGMAFVSLVRNFSHRMKKTQGNRMPRATIIWGHAPLFAKRIF
jgi:hypothetical protein